MLTVLADPRLVDFDSVKNSLKGIQVAMVCVICLSNLALIINRIARQGCRQVMYTPRYTIQISLAFGGIVSAMFYNVVSTMIIFDMEGHGLDCMTTYLANCYFFTFLPLIFCTGLILLAFDLILRFKFDVYKSLGNSCVYSFLCAILPWAVALGVSCPITLTDIQWDLKCANTQSNNHTQAAIICCDLVPAGLVLFLAVCVGISVRPKRYYDFQRGFDSPMFTISNVTTSSSNTDYNMNGTPGSIKKLNGSSPTENGNENGTETTSAPIQVTSSSDDNAYPSYNQAQGKSVSREKYKLLFSMLFVAFLVIPHGCVFVYITSEYDRLYTTLLFYMVDYDDYIAYYVTAHIQNLYPLLLPLVWLCTGY